MVSEIENEKDNMRSYCNDSKFACTNKDWFQRCNVMVSKNFGRCMARSYNITCIGQIYQKRLNNIKHQMWIHWYKNIFQP